MSGLYCNTANRLTREEIKKPQYTTHRRQQGIALVIFAISMVVIIGIAGLALDLSNVMLDDARIQNSMDACALSGAHALMNTPGDDAVRMIAAENAAEDTFKDPHNKNYADLTWDGADKNNVAVLFSATLEGSFKPIGSADAEPRYVRCQVENYSYSTKLARIFGIDDLGLKVRAVGGPIPINPCTPAPLLVCGNPDDTTCGPEEVNGEPNNPDGTCYGFTVYQDPLPNDLSEEECYLKACPPGGKCTELETGKVCGAQVGIPDGGGSQVADISAGNFDLLDVNCKSGKKGTPCIKEAFTDGGAVLVDGCPAETEYVTTKPGNTASVIDAFNTIFDGPNEDDHSTVENTEGNPFYYSDYLVGLDDDNNKRRILGVVIGDCDNEIIKKGKTQVPVLTVGCFFATKSSVKNPAAIWGQFIGKCGGTGEITTTQDAFDIYKIVLYKDYSGPDS